MNKKTFSTEAAYFAGLAILALGTALMEKADFGVSMVVAPAYLLHLKISETLPFFTFGMAEYCLQGVLLLLLTAVMKRFRLYYLFSFVTAVLYGLMLDGIMLLTGMLPAFGFAGNLAFFIIGMLLGSLAIALLFHTYIAPEAYELFVKEYAGKSGKDIHLVKTVYDCVSCLVAILLSFAFFGLWHFEGVKLGTIFCALINGWIISRFSHWLEGRFEFQDRWKLRKFFEEAK